MAARERQTGLAWVHEERQRPPLGTEGTRELRRCAALFLPGDPPRPGQAAFCAPDGGVLPAGAGEPGVLPAGPSSPDPERVLAVLLEHWPPGC